VADKLLSIIIPSFRDPRILETIASVRVFDDLGTVRLVIIDGGSGDDLVEAIRERLNDDDILISEPDRGIFDALNKGLDRVTTPLMGWIGSDDLYSVGAKSSKVVRALADHDLYVMDLLVVRGSRVRRRTHSWPSAAGLVKWGLHNPHYSTFGRSELLARYRFRLDLLGSDICYFLEVFGNRPRVLHDPTVGVLMAEGGFSSAGYKKIARINRQLFQSYRRQGNAFTAAAALAMKMGYKIAGLLQYKLSREGIARHVPFEVLRLRQLSVQIAQ
jgi:glycosyltransferase